jgi:hypothetical protein
MRLRVGMFLLCVAAFASQAAGCHRNRHDANAPGGDPSLGYGLGSADADDRKDAAEKLRKDGGPPPDAVPALMSAVQRERDNDARAEMLITLGASGAQEARPILESGLNDGERAVRNAAGKGLKLWNKRNGQIPPEQLAKLGSQDWKDRRDAADDLREDGGPPQQAVVALAMAASRERHPKALGAMLLTLGASGAPEAKPIIEAHVDDGDSDVRRYARRAMKSWLVRNGQNVRRDVETPAHQPAPTAAPTPQEETAKSAPPPPDGCEQFKGICGADPFAVDKCRTDMKALAFAQQVAWADCVNASTEACQKAHDSCVAKAKRAAK